MPSDPRSVAGPKPPFSKGFSLSTDLNLDRRWGWTPKFRRIDQEPEVRTGVMSSGWAVGMTSPRAAAPDVVLLRGNRKCSRGGFPLSLQVLARQADVQPSIFLGTSPWRSERTGLVHACRHGGLPLAPFDGLEPFARPRTAMPSSGQYLSMPQSPLPEWFAFPHPAKSSLSG